MKILNKYGIERSAGYQSGVCSKTLSFNGSMYNDETFENIGDKNKERINKFLTKIKYL